MHWLTQIYVEKAEGTELCNKKVNWDNPGECSPEKDYFTTELVVLTEGLTVMMTSAQVIEAIVKMPQASFWQLHLTG